MTKIALLLAAVVTLGFSSAASAAVTPTAKHQVRIAHVKVPITTKRTAHWIGTRKYVAHVKAPITPKTVHWIGSRKYVFVHGHKVWLSRQAQYNAKAHLTRHTYIIKQKPRQVQYTGKKHHASHGFVNKQKRTKVAS
jgi:hypothetical protein